MASIYDKIQTPAELVREVMCHGFSTKQDDICRAQDIIGRAPICDLAFLANDLGRDNEKGEPDPKGMISSGRRATQGTFYMILSSIWNWEDVTRFWNTHTNPEHEELKEARANLRETEKRATIAERNAKELSEEAAELSKRLTEAQHTVDEAQRKAAELEAEVMRLKARLFDYMEAAGA